MHIWQRHPEPAPAPNLQSAHCHRHLPARRLQRRQAIHTHKAASYLAAAFCSTLQRHRHPSSKWRTRAPLPMNEMTPAKMTFVGARTLLGAPGISTRSILTTSNKKLLGAKGIATRSKDATQNDLCSAPTCTRPKTHRSSALVPCSGTNTATHLAADPYSGTSTQASKRTQSPLPMLEIRTPIALTIWESKLWQLGPFGPWLDGFVKGSW